MPPTTSSASGPETSVSGGPDPDRPKDRDDDTAAGAGSSSLRDLDIVAAQLGTVENARAYVVDKMQASVQRGLETLVSFFF